MGRCILAAACGSLSSTPYLLYAVRFCAFMACAEGSLTDSQLRTCPNHRGVDIRFLVLSTVLSERDRDPRGASPRLSVKLLSVRRKLGLARRLAAPPQLLPGDTGAVETAMFRTGHCCTEALVAVTLIGPGSLQAFDAGLDSISTVAAPCQDRPLKRRVYARLLRREWLDNNCRR